MSALEPQPLSARSATTYDARRTRYLLLPEFRDSPNRVERRDRIAARLGLGRRLRDAVPNVQQHFEQQLFALISGVEIGHAALITSFLRAIVRFAVHRIEILENLLARAWTHASVRYRFRPCHSKANAFSFSPLRSTRISSCGIPRSASKRRRPAPRWQEWVRRPTQGNAAIRSPSTPTSIRSLPLTSTG